MKNFYITLLVFLAIYNNAQITVPLDHNNSDYTENGNYIKDINGHLDKFIGTWKYITPTEELTVKIVKGEHFDYGTFYCDELFGGYKYIKNNVILADRLNFQYSSPTMPNFALMIGGGLSSDYNGTSMPSSDIIGNREVYIDIQIIPNTNPVQMKWHMYNRENWVINNQTFKQGTGAGLPNDIILTKQ